MHLLARDVRESSVFSRISFMTPSDRLVRRAMTNEPRARNTSCASTARVCELRLWSPDLQVNSPQHKQTQGEVTQEGGYVLASNSHCFRMIVIHH